MARWDSGTQARLAKAALELFMERGYDDVTVTHIAERAGITRRSYFRYFPDKRAVLFAGSEKLPPAVYKAVRAAHRDTPPMAAALEALARVGAQLVEQSQDAAERRAVIDASPELQERDRTKRAEVAASIATALTDRGTDRDTARLVAQTATIVYENALARWIEAADGENFASCLDAMTTSLREAILSSTAR
ncbi:helix-turn-helix domain-containing protein [Streptomyces sp. B-S-A8]|uniref:Helix-turn-helix domain-containing protein n=1 Tax=Streptomyces solicavernae TaxID=3043614 RepID=A0ABT6RP11_9ACTN|nr:TetR/AcrR family transcriptional regulator [Streptomyces sp. B-S-A8]MDI3386166.1 helix-turn-helix domain-containing protein [Streptomyces sp. B-S-A8]